MNGDVGTIEFVQVILEIDGEKKKNYNISNLVVLVKT
jgi:hypothetical protein